MAVGGENGHRRLSAPDHPFQGCIATGMGRSLKSMPHRAESDGLAQTTVWWREGRVVRMVERASAFFGTVKAEWYGMAMFAGFKRDLGG